MVRAGRTRGETLIANETNQAQQLSASWKRSFRRRLLAWFEKHARDLPWRRSRDPYRVWVSEVMLQQTQVATVGPYFERFIAAFPTVEALAAADEQQVLRLWEGLGYYRRARGLHAAAKVLVTEHSGVLPRDVATLMQLPGIGRYTAGAIASIAFDRRAPILEANTFRLLTRLIAYRGDPTKSAGQRLLWQVAEEILPNKHVARFNQALMELGSLVCTPQQPQCAACPVEALCGARRLGLAEKLPHVTRKIQYTEVREAAIVVSKANRILVRQCGAEERWTGLWDFPRFGLVAQGPLFARGEIAHKVLQQTGIACDLGPAFHTLKHGVTRFRITLECYRAEYVSGRVRSTPDHPVRWIRPAELANLPLSVTGRKIALRIA
ncbi:MAG: A/G-specific adenine glycosylase [Pirellulales bacterium]